MPDFRPDWRCRACADGRLEPTGDHLSCDRCGAEVANEGGFWAFDPDFVPASFAPERRRHLADISDRHFWFAPRARLLTSVLRRRLDHRCRSALDLGCGEGAFLPALAEFSDHVVGIDAYGASLAVAAGRAPEAHLGQADIESPPLGDDGFDLIVMLDVLEHVDPDAVLAQAARMSVDGGWLLISVPAFPSLWSPLDAAAGHRCRYRLASLRPELERAGWDIEHWTHYQALAFPAVWLVRRLGRGRLVRQERNPSPAVSRVFGWLNALEVGCLSGCSVPWGSSLIVLCRRRR